MRAWSRTSIITMEGLAGVDVPYKAISILTEDDYNEYGDWLYYRAYPNERDSRNNRPIPRVALESRTVYVSGALTPTMQLILEARNESKTEPGK